MKLSWGLGEGFVKEFEQVHRPQFWSYREESWQVHNRHCDSKEKVKTLGWRRPWESFGVKGKSFLRYRAYIWQAHRCHHVLQENNKMMGMFPPSESFGVNG